MSGYIAIDETGSVVARAGSLADLYRVRGATAAAYCGPDDPERIDPALLALMARGDLAAIAALSVSALTLAIEPLTLDQLEALLLIEGRRVGGGRSTALREISLAIDAVRA